MTWLSGFIRKQGQHLLENNQYAILQAIALALLPYTAWLSVAIIALVTLRRGWVAGGYTLLPAFFAYVALALFSTKTSIALVNASLLFVPCYLGACALRLTVSWRAVAAVFFLQVLIVMLLLQIFMPDFIMAQYVYIQAVMREAQAESALIAFINDKTGLNQVILANYLIGLQSVGVVLSACLSLMLARSIQSQLFYPEGYKREMLSFRGDKIGLLILIIMLVAASQQSALAMSLLPILIFYFLMAGLSLSFNLLARQKPWRLLVLLLAALFIVPFIMLPVYVIFGSLDSLFNFRLYLPPSDAGKTV